MKVLIIDRFPEDFLAALRALPLSLTYVPEAQRPEILPLLAEAEILILNSKIQVDAAAAAAAPLLRWVIRAGVGMDHIDTDYLAARGVRAVFTAGANADSVGEQAVGMLLALHHHILRADRQVRQFQWQREANRGLEIGGKTVGIIGYGHTGRAVARRLAGFGCQVLAYDKYLRGFSDAYAREAGLEDLYETADIVSFHIPLDASTRHWASRDFFQRFRKPITLLNLARGPIVQLDDLLDALDAGKVRAAALDVLENEKLDSLSPTQRASYERLFAHDRVALTPHIGGWSVESLTNINRAIVEIVKQALAEAGG